MHLDQRNKTKPYLAQVRRGGNMVHLGYFATAEEAALCLARSPEGRAAATKAAAAPPPTPALTGEEALQQAQAEGLTLLVAESKTGYLGVYYNSSKPKPYKADVWSAGKNVYLGRFATAEEAALCIARSPEGQAAAGRAAAAPMPLTSEEARQQAQAEGLTLLKADSKSGYFSVYLTKPGQPKPYQAKVRRDSKEVTLGSFVTAEEAALCVARSPEGRKAVERAASAPPPPRMNEDEGQGKPPAMPSRAVLKEEGTVPPMPPGAFIKEEEVVPLMQLLDAVVKREHEVVVDEGGCSEGRPKRRRKN